MKTRTVQLGEVAEIGAGQGAPQDAAAFSREGHAFIRAGSLEILCNLGSLTLLERVSEHVAGKHRLRLYPENTIVFARSGMSATKNRIYRLREPCYVVNHLATVKPGTELNATFLRYWFEYFDPTSLIQDPAYPSISQEDIAAVTLLLPPLPEQHRIAAMLEEADRLRRTRRYALELSDSFLPATFLEMFGNNPFPYVALEELATDDRNSFVNGPFGSDLLTSELTDSGVPVIYIRDISSGRYERTSSVFVTPAKAAELDFCNVKSGDILVAKVGDPPGIAAIYPSTEPDGIVTQDVIRIRPNIECVSAFYLQGFLNSRLAQWEMSKIMVEGTRLRFSLGQFKELSVILPPLPLQQRFAELVRGHEKLRASQRESLRQVEHLFQSLLHQAFTDVSI